MSKTLSIDPITRIEGHLAIRIEVEEGRVVDAYSSGEMFRGFEMILKGRDPLDAQQITQRICGVCPISHGTASILAQENAYGIRPPQNGRVIRNLILASNFIQSHILHFYQLSALDFVDIAAITEYQGRDPRLEQLKSWVQSQMSSNLIYPAAPFLPRYAGDYIDNSELNILAIRHYLEAFEMRALAHKLGAVFAGKLPHATTLVPGGVTEKVTAKRLATCRSVIRKLQSFIDHAYLQDVVEVASAFPGYFSTGRGCGNFLTYGVFPESDEMTRTFLPSGVLLADELTIPDPSKITEDVKYSRFSSPSGLRPDRGQTRPAPDKAEAYSWIKAPRYDKTVVEVGPLARMMVAYRKGEPGVVKAALDTLLKRLGREPNDLISVLGRHAARAVECKILADRTAEWIEQLVPEGQTFNDFDIPARAQGMGLTEAPRGALGHWLSIDDYKISNYQCVVPTTWNCSPRDDTGVPGAVEQALIGTPISDEKNPIEATRVVRSFDPCIACAVH